jgi:hypothetical protein
MTPSDALVMSGEPLSVYGPNILVACVAPMDSLPLVYERAV